MNRVLIIGKRGFIGQNLFKHLKKTNKVSHISFKKLKIIKKKINDFDYIINTSIDKDYIFNKYNSKKDNDLTISKILNDKSKYILLSSRKVYQSKENIKEYSKLSPKSNYSKNKLITEKKLQKILKKNLIILRISNIIGDRKFIKSIHKTFIDILFSDIKKGIVTDNKKNFKDFISIEKFCEIIEKILEKKITGIYNVSIGKKIYLNDLISWINKYNRVNITFKNQPNKLDDCFYLNNQKLMKKIKIKNSIKDLKDYCLKLSKKKFT